MTYPVAVVTSDCHLAERTWTGRRDLYGDAYYSFRQIVDYAVEHELPVLAAGDLIDKQKNVANVVGFLREQIDRLEQAELSFFYIQGQHELQQETTWLSAISSWPSSLNGNYAELDPFVVKGSDWLPMEQAAVFLDQDHSDADLLVMHQVTDDWMGGVTTGEISFSQIRGVNTLVIGDYHVSMIEQHKNGDGEPLQVLSPGSTCLQAINEPPSKYFYVLYSNMTFEAIPLQTRRVLLAPTIYLESDFDQFIEQLPSQIDKEVAYAIEHDYPAEIVKPILRLSYSTDIPDVYPRLIKTIDNKAHFFSKGLRPEPSEQVVEKQQEAKKILEDGVLAALDTMPLEKDSDVYAIAKRLLSTQDVRSELFQIRKERLGIE
jgi:hypothetical protein